MNDLYHRLSFIVLLLLAPFMRVQAASRLAVVELYTSEGCSSCPPAEEYVGELMARSDVLVLSFHVDYWDDLGWRDPFALSASTARQRGYSSRLKLNSVFTPQVIVDGHESLVGSDWQRISESLRAPREAFLELTLIEQEGSLVVSAKPSGTGELVDLLLVPFRGHAKSSVGRGENQGRTLEEFDIVRELRVIGHTRGEPLHLRVALSSFPKDATDVAVLAQRQRQGEIVGAARLDLTSSLHYLYR
jgi:hypothetical protein